MWGGGWLGRGAQWARVPCWDGPCRGRAALLVACGGNPVRDRQRVPWARLACACASCPSRPWWNGTGPAAVDRRSLRLTARARAKRPAQVRHGRHWRLLATSSTSVVHVCVNMLAASPRRPPPPGRVDVPGREAAVVQWSAHGAWVCAVERSSHAARTGSHVHAEPARARARARTLSCSATRRRCLCCNPTP